MKTPIQDLLKQIAPLPYKRDFELIKDNEFGLVAEVLCKDSDRETATYLVHAANTLPSLIPILQTALEELRLGQRIFVDHDPKLEWPFLHRLEEALKQASEVEV